MGFLTDAFSNSCKISQEDKALLGVMMLLLLSGLYMCGKLLCELQDCITALEKAHTAKFEANGKDIAALENNLLGMTMLLRTMDNRQSKFQEQFERFVERWDIHTPDGSDDEGNQNGN
jgi:hypothetical protein